MAEFHVFKCDRCGEETRIDAPPQVRTPSLPTGWNTVGGAKFSLLCERCINDLNSFIGGAKIIYEQV